MAMTMTTNLVAILAALLTASFWKPASAINIADICDEIEVTISVDYKPLNPDSRHNNKPSHNYYVKSAINLTCTANVPSEGAVFNWTSTCNGSEPCFVAAGNGSNIVGTFDLQKHDAGVHTCTVYDPVSGCHKSASITMNVVDFNVFIETIYNPPDQYPDYEPPNYRAASSVTLRCVAEGTVGGVQYQWSSTCDNCFATNSSSSTITENILRSRDAGVHTCTVKDSSGVVERKSIEMNIVGAGIYVTHSIEYGGTQAAQPNNTYIVADTGPSSSATRVSLYCCSNSSTSGVGSFTFPDGTTTSTDYSTVSIQQQSGEYAGCILFQIVAATYISYQLQGNHGPGIILCNVPDANGRVNQVSFGLFDEGYDSVPYVKRTIRQTNSNTSVTITCESYNAPPTEVTWLKDGQALTIDGTNTQVSVSILNTAYYSYSDTWDTTYSISLTINDNPFNTVGEYQCIIGNSFGNNSSPLIINNGIQLVGRNESFVSDHLDLNCSTNLTLSSLELWREEELVAQSNNNSILYIIDPVSTHEQGVTYTCRGYISHEYFEESSLTLSVEVPSKWAMVYIVNATHENKLYAQSDSNFSMQCAIRPIPGLYLPLSEVEWSYFNDSLIQNESNIAYINEENTTRQIVTPYNFNPLQKAHEGSYTCRISLTIPWMPAQPSTLSTSVDLFVTTLNVTIVVSYNPPDQYPDYGPPNYRAASSVTLRCVAPTTVDVAQYQWSSSCENCFASESKNSTIGEHFLRSRDAGVHVCIITDKQGNTGSASIQMNIVGAGIYVVESNVNGNDEYNGPQPNNTGIQFYYYSTTDLFCCSSSTSTSIGSFTSPLSRTRDYGWPGINVNKQSGTYAGCIRFTIPRYTEYTTIRRGVYTCNIPDATGQIQHVHFGLVDTRFLNLPSLRVTSTQPILNINADSISLTCLARGTLPATMSWKKNNNDILIDNKNTLLTQSLSNRGEYRYSYTLTIRDTTTNLIGAYSCGYRNRYGYSSESQRSVNVEGIKIEQSRAEVNIGGSVMFTCSSDIPSLYYTNPPLEWYHNGEFLPDHNQTFTLVNTSTLNMGNYTCRITTTSGQVLEKNTTLGVIVPSSWTRSTSIVNVTSSGSQYALNGSNHTLTCVIEAVTGVYITPSIEWGVDTSQYVITNSSSITVGPPQSNGLVTTSTLSFHPITEANAGRYTCTASLSFGSWRSSYLPRRQESVNIVVGLEERQVDIQVTYNSPDQYPSLGPNEYRAASSVTLQCVAKGMHGSVSYLWTSTCSSCFARNSRSATISELFLRSRDTGIHTCTVQDSIGVIERKSIQMNIVGAGIYVIQSERDGGVTNSQPNNSYILMNSGAYYSYNNRVAFYCCSNSTSTSVGSFIFPDKVIRGADWRNFDIRRQFGAYAGCVRLSITIYGRYSLNSDAGVYTCSIPDDNERTQRVHFGLYDEHFSSAPRVTRIENKAYNTSMELSCTSEDAPPTSVTWLSNGEVVKIDGNTTQMSQRILSRRTSSYYTTLTILADNPHNLQKNYTCIIGNNFGNSSKFLLSQAVRISTSTENLIIGQAATVYCNSDLPIARKEWLRNGNLVSSADGEGTTADLVLDPVTIEDAQTNYTCRVTTAYDTEEMVVDLDIQVPREWATIEIVNFANSQTVYTLSDGDYTLTCRIRRVDRVNLVPTVEWIGPNGTTVVNSERVNITVSNEESETVSVLRFDPLLVADQGGYTCTGSLSAPWLSRPPPALVSSIDLVIGDKKTRNVTIQVDYTPPGDSNQVTNYKDSNFQITGSVTLKCMVGGTVGVTNYQWSSTCTTRCFASNSRYSTTSETFLRSRDDGVHTCTVTDDIGVVGSTSINMNIVGAGIYVTQSEGHGGNSAAQPNNTYILINSGRFYSYSGRVSLYCCSNNPTNIRASFTFPNGLTRSYDNSFFELRRETGTYAGCSSFELSRYGTFYLSSGSTAGVYTCNIHNENGILQHVHFGLYNEDFITVPRVIRVYQSHADTNGFTITCESADAPPTNLTWFREGVKVEVDGINFVQTQSIGDRFFSTYLTNLTIKLNENSKLEDFNGTYMCTAGNRFGSSSGNVDTQGIRITTSSELIVGQSVRYTCKSDFPANVEWFIGGTPVENTIEGDSLAYLDINPITTDNEGEEYTCKVYSDIIGTLEQTLTLSTSVPDEWATIRPTYERSTGSRPRYTHYVLAGDNGSITCTVSAIEGMKIPPSIEWFDENNLAIESNENTTISETQTNGLVTNSTLSFTPVQLSHKGSYTCRASVMVPWMSIQPAPLSASVYYVAVSPEIERKVDIQVIYNPPDQYPDYEPPNYRAASSVTLRCVAEGTVGGVRYQWSSTCDNCFATSSSSSTITENILRSRDAGVHTCTVSDGLGLVQSRSLDMNIIGAGIYASRSSVYGGHQRAQPNNTYVSSTLGLYCCSNSTFKNIGSLTLPNGDSLFDDQYYENYLRLSLDRSNPSCLYLSAQFSRYTRRNVGVFTCNIPDSNGKIHYISFTLINNLRISPNVSELTSEVSTTALTLSCESNSAPPTNVTWLKNGVELSINETTTELTQVLVDRISSTYLTSLTTTTDDLFKLEGTYTCLISNKIGYDSMDIAIEGLRIVSNSTELVVGQTVVFTCESDFVVDVQWFQDDNFVSQSRANESSTSFVLDPVSTDHEGIGYLCRVDNTDEILERNITLSLEVPEQWATIELNRTINQTLYALRGTTPTLVCMVKAVRGMNIIPTIEWVDQNNNVIKSGDHITVGNSQTEGMVTTSTLYFNPVSKTDAGMYECRASLPFIAWTTTQPPTLRHTIDIIVTDFKVTIETIYTPPDQYPDYKPPNYRAASSVTLRCVAEGTTGAIQFNWISTCDNCFVTENFLSATISESILTSRDSGVHVCNVLDSAGYIGSNSTQMNVVGAGIHVFDSPTYGGVQPNNTLIIADRESNASRSINLYCCSSSNLPVSFTFPDGYTSRHNRNRYPIQFASQTRTYKGCTQLSVQRSSTSYISPGVYTCNAPHSNGEITHVSFGLYLTTFQDAPNVRSLEYTTSDTRLIMKCISDKSPPTNIMWLKNGKELTIDGNATQMSQRVLDRTNTVYETTLTIEAHPYDYIGNYTCFIANIFGNDYKELSIQALQITKTVDRLIVGQNATIKCSSGLHVTSVEWLQLSASSEVNDGYAQFQLAPISTDDWGTVYTCKVTVSFDILTEAITLRPEVPNNWGQVEITGSSGLNPLHGSKYNLTCTVKAIDGINIQPYIEWILPTKKYSREITYSKTKTEGTTSTSTLSFDPIFTPYGGDYSCRSTLFVSWMPTQLPVLSTSINVGVKTQQNIQLLIFGKGPLLYCTSLDIRNAQALEESIKSSIELGVRKICNCDFSSSIIHSGRFSCPTEATSLTYRATIDGSNESYTAQQLVQFIEQWRTTHGSILYTIFELKVATKQQCPLSIESFDDPECE